MGCGGMRCAVPPRQAEGGEGAALFPGGRRGAALSPAADRGKGAALFSAGDLTWCREVESRALHATDT